MEACWKGGFRRALDDDDDVTIYINLSIGILKATKPLINFDSYDLDKVCMHLEILEVILHRFMCHWFKTGGLKRVVKRPVMYQ